MDYEEKYKEALERARQIQNTPYTAHWDVMKEVVEDIFPELAESEDERIRKHLIGVVELYYGYTDEQEKKDCLAWLEKQGEQKPADKVVPKFKVGDIIRLKGSAAEYTIKKVTDTTYYTNGWSCGIKRCEEDYELVEQKPTEWSEEDEKTIVKMRDFFIRVLGDKPDFTEDKRYEEFIEFIDNRLKSLRPHSSYHEGFKKGFAKAKEMHYDHWKPSEEQMQALDGICSYIRNKADWEISQDMASDLYKLSEQLKKLKD